LAYAAQPGLRLVLGHGSAPSDTCLPAAMVRQGCTATGLAGFVEVWRRLPLSTAW
jgi:hypothetical protein